MFIHNDPCVHVLLPVQHMNREDIICMVQETIFAHPNNNHFDFQIKTIEQLQHFASLVADAERHECAKIVDGNADGCNGMTEQILRSNAAAIRARGQA